MKKEKQDRYQYGVSRWETVSRESFIRAEVDKNNNLDLTTRTYDHGGNMIEDSEHTCTHYRSSATQAQREVTEIYKWFNSGIEHDRS